MARPPNSAHRDDDRVAQRGQYAAPRGLVRGCRRRGADHPPAHPDDDADQDDQPGNPEEGAVDAEQRLLADRIGDHGAFLHFDALQEEHRAQIGSDESTEAVERLAEGQAEVAALGRSEGGRKRVGGDLQDGDPAGEHEQSEQHERIFRDVRCSEHDHAAGDHQAERDQDRADRLLARQQHCGGKAHHAIGDEEGRGAQLRFHVAELEDALHRRDQRVDQRSDESPGEEQAGDDRVGAGHCCRTAIRLRHATPSKIMAAPSWQGRKAATREE